MLELGFWFNNEVIILPQNYYATLTGSFWQPLKISTKNKTKIQQAPHILSIHVVFIIRLHNYFIDEYLSRYYKAILHTGDTDSLNVFG